MIDIGTPATAAALALSCALLLSGCASPGASLDPADVARFEAMDCVQLNDAVRRSSADISRIAITRGKAEEVAIPTWLPGGTRLQASYADRQTARIERLRQEQDAAISVRRSKC